jgi:hypothetical protein
VTLQNRVLPSGEIVAIPERGTMMGNRGGAIHRTDRTLGAARWRSKAWICCLLSFKDRRREVMTPGRYTELFFLDEAVALAAGHRPCAECRRDGFRRFASCWEAAGLGPSRAGAMDALLHAARLSRRADGSTHDERADLLPDGTMIALPAGPALILGNAALPFRPSGYGPPVPRPRGTVAVLVPEPVVAVLAEGYLPVLHPSAEGILSAQSKSCWVSPAPGDALRGP